MRYKKYAMTENELKLFIVANGGKLQNANFEYL